MISNNKSALVKAKATNLAFWSLFIKNPDSHTGLTSLYKKSLKTTLALFYFFCIALALERDTLFKE
jgi:hypothetical protein